MTTTLLVETPVHGRVLVRPAAAQPARGLLVGLHGYGEDAAAHMDRLQRLHDAGNWTLVSVQALNRFYRGRSEEVVAGWMTRQDREAAIADNIAYVDRAMDVVVDGASAPGRLVYAGFSQGVAMAFRAALRGRRPPSGVVAVGGDVPPELLADPSVRFPRVLLVRGATDDWYTRAKLDADVAALTARGVAVDARTVPGGHEWNAAVTAVIDAWLDGLA